MTKKISPKFSKVQVVAFIDKNSWINKMNRSKGLDSFDNYSGGVGDNGHWVVVPGIGRNRDSEILQESNFDAALELLGGESKNVEIVRFGHWGCGWFELIRVNPKSLSKIQVAMQIQIDLDHYPVLDECDFSERENEYQIKFADEAKDDLAENLAKHFKIENSLELVEIACELNLQCQNYYGNDSCVDIYSRVPDNSDIKRLLVCIDQVAQSHCSSINNKLLTQLQAKVKAFKIAA